MLHSTSTKNHRIESWVYANAAARTGATGFVTADIGQIAYQTDTASYWRLTATTPAWLALAPYHKLENWTYANTAAREAATGMLPEDIGKIAYQSDDGTYWRLTDDSPVTWAAVGAATGGGGLPPGGDTGQVLTKVSGDDDDADWEDAASGAPPPGVAIGLVDQAWNIAQANNTTEQNHIVETLNANTAYNVVSWMRIRAWGTITNDTTPITFTPRIRIHTATTPGAGLLVLTGPLIEGTATAQTNKAWELEVDIFFTGLGPGTVRARMSIREHTSDAGGAPKFDFNNSTNTDVSSFTDTVQNFVQLSWQMSATTGSPNVKTLGATVETGYH